MARATSKLQRLLTFIYGSELGLTTYANLKKQIANDLTPYATRRARRRDYSQEDVVLITYGDQVQAASQPHLQTLADFCKKYLADCLNTVHILPFFPYSSDDGFSVIDYKRVNPTLGDWSHVERLGADFRLMFDAVINHISAESDWFHAFLQNNPRFRDFFMVVEPDVDLTAVFRPRTLPLLTPVETASGTKQVWTTFSSDQIDLNYSNPDVLLAIIDTLLFYVQHGAELIRLDAIAFLWKEIGTSCIHLPQTHAVIQIMRAVLDEVAPQVALITETNVPHAENVSYFGNGRNEAQMVYNFSLPPLTLHAFHTGDATILSKWARELSLPSDDVTFFNFLASHDGIGLMPTRGILSNAAITKMAQRIEALGGHVSYKNNGNGTKSPYELNINYLDALCDPEIEEDLTLIAQRFLAAQAVMLSLRGVPGVYFHSLFGSRSWHAGVAQTDRHRSINREKLQAAALEAELGQPGSLRQLVFDGYCQMLRVRAAEAAFHPLGQQEVLDLHPAVFALLRSSGNGRSHILCLHNVSNQSLDLCIPLDHPLASSTHPLTELISNRPYPITHQQLKLNLRPFQILWLRTLV